MKELMTGVVVPIVVGIILIVLGIINTTGNISSLHSYHRNNVSEENRKPFGKRVGIGLILVGIGTIMEGIMIFLAEKMQNEAFATAGTVLMVVIWVPAFILIFAAMKKYNGGIF